MKTTPKKNGGFTLVELIVVIAILAILAAVAIPAYSGYIEKAEKAGDLQILGAINTAFAAACTNEGFSQYDVKGAMIPVDTNGQMGTESFTQAAANTNPGTPKFVASLVFTDNTGMTNAELIAFNNAFALFFSGNETVAFKTIKSGLFYDPTQGGFVAMEDYQGENITMSYGGGVIVVSKKAVDALTDSTFYGENMDSEKLLSQVDNVAGVAGLMGTVQNVMQTEGYVNAALSSLGITPSTDPAANAELLNKKAEELALKKMGLTNISQITEENKAEYGEHLKNISNNALVIYTAQSTTALGVEGAKNLLNGVNSTMIKDAMDGNLAAVDKATGMNQAALAYGMYYAYVNSDQCTDESIKGKTNIGALDVIAALDSGEDSEFRTYMNSNQGTKDMEAYLQALSVINSSAQSPEAVEKLVSEGFASDDLLALLKGAMGK